VIGLLNCPITNCPIPNCPITSLASKLNENKIFFKPVAIEKMLIFMTVEETTLTRHKIINLGHPLALGTIREHFCPRTSVLALHFLIVYHTNCNFLDCDWFEKLLISTNSLAKLLSDSLLLDRCMGYWPSVRSRWLDIGQVLFLSPKKERGQCPAILTEQTWSIKDLLYGFRGNFSCGIQRVVQSGSGSQSQHVIWFILPTRGASHIIKFVIGQFNKPIM